MPPPLKGQSVTHVAGIRCYLSLRKDIRNFTTFARRRMAFEARCPFVALFVLGGHGWIHQADFSRQVRVREARVAHHVKEPSEWDKRRWRGRSDAPHQGHGGHGRQSSATVE